MIRSMTAYARAASPVKEGGWQAEIRSINSRYFEFSLKISPAFNVLENRIREMAQASMRRGKVTLSIFQEGPEDHTDSLGFDEKKISFYLSQIKKVKKKYKNIKLVISGHQSWGNKTLLKHTLKLLKNG